MLELITRCHSHLWRIDGWLDDRGISQETALKWRIGYDYDCLTPYTANRVTIPVWHPWSGFPVTITARRTVEIGPKWMHIPFRATRIVFGMVRHRRLDALAVVEGPLDAIALESAGVPAVASFGAHPLSDWQIGLLLRWTRSFLLYPDDDKSGIDARHHWELRLRELGCQVTLGPYPGDEDDPDQLARARPDFVRRIYESACRTVDSVHRLRVPSQELVT